MEVNVYFKTHIENTNGTNYQDNFKEKKLIKVREDFYYQISRFVIMLYYLNQGGIELNRAPRSCL